MSPTFPSIVPRKLSASAGFFVVASSKLPGRARAKHPKRIDAEITIGERSSAIYSLRNRSNLSPSQACAIFEAEYGPITNSPFYYSNSVMTTTIKSLVRRNILVPVLSDEEYAIQVALGTCGKHNPRWYELNDLLINLMVYTFREQDWFDYTE